MDFWQITLGVHNLVRWLVVLAGVVAFVTMLVGLFSGSRFERRHRSIGQAYVIALDVQLLVGVLLYVISPIVQTGLRNFGDAMRDADVRFFLVEHGLLMLIAVALGHVGHALAKKEGVASRSRFTRGALFYGLSLAVIFYATPWGRSLVPWG